MKKYYSAAMLFAAAAIWGLGFSAQKVAMLLPPVTLCAVRSAFVAIFLLGVIVVFDKTSGCERRLFSRKNNTAVV